MVSCMFIPPQNHHGSTYNPCCIRYFSLTKMGCILSSFFMTSLTATITATTPGLSSSSKTSSDRLQLMVMADVHLQNAPGFTPSKAIIKQYYNRLCQMNVAFWKWDVIKCVQCSIPNTQTRSPQREQQFDIIRKFNELSNYPVEDIDKGWG